MEQLIQVRNPVSPKCLTYFRVNQLFDGIAGRKQGSTLQYLIIIVDYRVPTWMYPGLVVHEWSEMKYELQGHAYPGSHEMATADERRFIGEKLWSKYNGIYLKLLNIIYNGPKGKDPLDMYYGHQKGPIGGNWPGTLPNTVRTGDLYAKRIELHFKDWVLSVRSRPNFTNLDWSAFNPTQLIHDATYSSKLAEAKAIERRLNVKGLALNLRSEEAETWIDRYAATEIKYIDSASKQTIKTIIQKGFQEGLTSEDQARQIRSYIGLTPQQYQAVENYMNNLGIDDETRVWELGEKYGQKLLNQRAETIALTEGHIASNEGYMLENSDAVDRGILDPEIYEYEWLLTEDERLCNHCESHRGDRTDLPFGTFANGDEPARIHQRCRCTRTIVRK